MSVYQEVLRRDPCVYCGARGGILDHVQPRLRGGSDHWTNLAGCCGSCNSSKGAKSLLGFLGARATKVTARAAALQAQMRALSVEARGWKELGLR